MNDFSKPAAVRRLSRSFHRFGRWGPGVAAPNEDFVASDRSVRVAMPGPNFLANLVPSRPDQGLCQRGGSQHHHVQG